MPPYPEVYIGNLGPHVTEMDVWNEVIQFPTLFGVYWVSEEPQGFVFVKFRDLRCVLNAVRNLNGINGWLVQHHYAPNRCYRCGESGHRAQECPHSHWGRGRCYRCGGFDHVARDCPQVHHHRAPIQRGHRRRRSHENNRSPPHHRRARHY